MQTQQAECIEIFMSYASTSSKDRRLRKDLETHLSALKQQGLITIWHDQKMSAGSDQTQEINAHLNAAHIILLLISPDYLASPQCEHEMIQAMQRYHAGTAQVIPLLLRPCDWRKMSFATLKMLPDDARSITSWPRPDDALTAVAKALRSIVESFHQQFPPRLVQQTQFYIPYERNYLFTGREEVLQRLYHALRTKKTVALAQAIRGLGGIGKTQTALEYAYRYQSEYETILWIRANSPETLQVDLDTIAYLLQIPQRNEHDPALTMQAVKHWLHEHSDWLLILDNADDLSVLRNFLPTTTSGHILLTTRMQATRGIAPGISLEEMKGDDGVLLLLRRAGLLNQDEPIEQANADDHEAANALVHIMGGLPLALDQAGAYIEETQCGLVAYLHLYQTRQAELLARRGQWKTDHPDSVTTTWSLSFEHVQNANPVVIDMLRLFAFLDPDEIPEALLTSDGSALTPGLQTLCSDPIAYNDAIRLLLNYSLIRRNPNHTVSIHRLVQAILRLEMNVDTQKQWAEQAIVSVNAVFPYPRYENWDHCQPYLSHAQYCTQSISQWNSNFVKAGQLQNKLGSFFNQQGKYEKAKPLLLRALYIAEQALGPTHPDTASSLNNLASLYENQGKYKEAEPLLLRALYIREQALGPTHPHTASSLNNLASLYKEQGKYKEAEPLYQRALHIQEQTLDPIHPHTAGSLNNLASLYDVQGKYEEAEPLYLRALNIAEQALGPIHPDTATCLNNLASLYDVQGKYEEAEPLSLRALNITEQALGPIHPHTAGSLNNLASLYKAQGKYEEAEPLLLRALCTREQALGPTHPDTASSLNNLASLYDVQGKYEEAESLYLRALNIAGKAFGSNHHLKAINLNNLASLYKNQGKYKEAEILYQRAVTICMQHLGPNHPYTLAIQRNLSSFHQIHNLHENQQEYTTNTEKSSLEDYNC